ncbi:MAG: septal ring lytic transglycosylase RlpA family protein [Alphaproteobacteria bacterium]
MVIRFLILMALVPMGLSGCARIELASHVGKKMMGSKVRTQGYYKVGSPYTIKGKKYYPSVDYDYNQTGVASWYGPNFHGKMTANGETYNQNDLTAAHKTLPMPSIVRVTNLENGLSLIVRVNDRGPYAHGRIIDLSKRSAELLKFKNQGVAKVRVQLLEAESRMVAETAKQGRDTRGMEVPMNQKGYKPKVMQASTQPKSMQPAKVAHVQKGSSLTSSDMQALPGHVRDGNFYPDPVMSQYPVGTQRVYVQMASFTTRDNAMRYSSSLGQYGRAQIHPVTLDGVTYYRVRFPASNVAEADALLERFIANGHQNTRIVVD